MSDTDYRDLPQQDILDAELSGDEDSNVEEGEISSDAIDKQDQTEDMTYRETVRSVWSFMGWNHIPVHESDLSEPDKSNNPWKRKNPKKPAWISVAMTPDDWLCQKLEKLKNGGRRISFKSAGFSWSQARSVCQNTQESKPLVSDTYYKTRRSISTWQEPFQLE